MEHIEEAGIHSGDSACVLPPIRLGQEMIEEIKAATRALALELHVKGLMNIQFAVKDGQLYRSGSKPPRLPDRTLCQQVNRHPLGQGGHAADAGPSLAEMDYPGDSFRAT